MTPFSGSQVGWQSDRAVSAAEACGMAAVCSGGAQHHHVWQLAAGYAVRAGSRNVSFTGTGMVPFNSDGACEHKAPKLLRRTHTGLSVMRQRQVVLRYVGRDTLVRLPALLHLNRPSSTSEEGSKAGVLSLQATVPLPAALCPTWAPSTRSSATC